MNVEWINLYCIQNNSLKTLRNNYYLNNYLEGLCLCINREIFVKWARNEKDCFEHKANPAKGIIYIFSGPFERISIPLLYGKMAKRPNGQPH